MTTTITILGVALTLAAIFITLNCPVITRLRSKLTRSKTHIDSIDSERSCTG